MKAGSANFLKLIKFEAFNVIRARWLIFYGLFFAGFTLGLLQFGGDARKVAASLSSVVLLIVPMASVLYGTVYWYSAEAFTQLLLTQPLRRGAVYLARWVAISLSLGGTFVLGTFFPLLITGALDSSSGLLLFTGFMLSLIFVAIGMLAAVWVKDRMRGIGVAFVVWLYFAVLHDTLVFFLVTVFRDYPIETPAMLLMAVNPIDLARVSLLMGLDMAAMMGYTGRMLQKFLGYGKGLSLMALLLFAWAFLPAWAGARKFRRKDL